MQVWLLGGYVLSKKMWFVGQFVNKEMPIEIGGIFDDKKKAIKSCTLESHFIVGPFQLNEILEEKSSCAKVAFYPNLETEKEGIKRYKGEYEQT